MITCQHTCDKYEVVIDDYVEIGIDAVSPVRTSNDPVMFWKKYGERPMVVGGMDSPKPVGQESASEEMCGPRGRGWHMPMR